MRKGAGGSAAGASEPVRLKQESDINKSGTASRRAMPSGHAPYGGRKSKPPYLGAFFYLMPMRALF